MLKRYENITHYCVQTPKYYDGVKVGFSSFFQQEQARERENSLNLNVLKEKSVVLSFARRVESSLTFSCKLARKWLLQKGRVETHPNTTITLGLD